MTGSAPNERHCCWWRSVHGAPGCVDLGTKRLAYEAVGVPEYWLIDPEAPSLTVLRLIEGHYEEVARVTGDERYEATYPFPVTIVPGSLGRRRHP